jgi:molecular chaperone IbpA
MKMFDATPLFRSSVGFDRMMDLFESVNRLDQAAPTYPPYNIEKVADDAYRVTLAVAGFGLDDLNVEMRDGLLIVKGAKPEGEQKTGYLHRGIAERAFERRFQLAEHVEVRGAGLDNGLLTIDLVREVPEALKPRRIEVKAGGPTVIEARQAA